LALGDILCFHSWSSRKNESKKTWRAKSQRERMKAKNSSVVLVTSIYSINRYFEDAVLYWRGPRWLIVHTQITILSANKVLIHECFKLMIRLMIFLLSAGAPIRYMYWYMYSIAQTENAKSVIPSQTKSTVRGQSRWFNADHDRGQILSFSSPSRNHVERGSVVMSAQYYE